MRINELAPVFVEQIPPNDEIKEGVIYITESRCTAIHLCACGCRKQVVNDLKPDWDDGWTLIKNSDGTVTLRPSQGNFRGENPYHAHYFITNNKIEWV